MLCQKCGYLLEPMDLDCPRCIRIASTSSTRSTPNVNRNETAGLSQLPKTQAKSRQADLNPADNSGLGKFSVLPDELKGFNWGALLCSWLWSINHRTWIGLFSLIPNIGWIMWIVLGFKGNEWAWQNRKWDSIEEFKIVQDTWTRWGVWLFVFALAVGVLSVKFIAMEADSTFGSPPQSTSPMSMSQPSQSSPSPIPDMPKMDIADQALIK